ncbi:hypothetical protein IRJ41_009875 [Triplophysa rosa]|uniref:Uncharacterized protein n=1 Tax=Triplophysa rosa TaxID=992332 RepID=A0A9W7TTZ6_TRIRA|nr:hypothetical protein IRJ41_009875 [Triplophysa rosa]
MQTCETSSNRLLSKDAACKSLEAELHTQRAAPLNTAVSLRGWTYSKKEGKTAEKRSTEESISYWSLSGGAF